jgi:sugar lactone lactonase YvrE
MHITRNTVELVLASTLALVAPLACGGGDPGDTDASTTAGTTGDPGAPTSSGTTSEPDTTSAGTTGDTTTGDATTTGDTDPGDEVVLIPGFMTPESVHWEPQGQRWYVSNIVGTPGMKDGQGWISQLDQDGAILAEKWVEGLDTPAGIRSFGGSLFVADIDEVHVIDLASATISETVAVPGAMFLNDVTVDAEGVVYVADTATHTIHRIKPGEAPEVVVQDPGLQAPNGLYVLGQALLVASIGSVMPDDIVAPLFKVTLPGPAYAQFGALTGKFDGVELDGADLLVTDFRGQLLRVGPTGEGVVVRDFLADGLMSTADFGFDPVERVVAIPDLVGNQVALWHLPD